MIYNSIMKRTRLWDELAKYFHSVNNMSFEISIEDITRDYPDVLRLIAKDMEEKEPDAVNTIDAIKHSADAIEGVVIEPPKESYWETRKRLFGE